MKIATLYDDDGDRGIELDFEDSFILMRKPCVLDVDPMTILKISNASFFLIDGCRAKASKDVMNFIWG